MQRSPAKSAKTPEDQILANLKAQPCGVATVADLALPDAFLRRIAARVLQPSFQEHFRTVVAPAPARTEHEIWRATSPPCEVAVCRFDFPNPDAPQGPVAMPAARGFMPQILPDDQPLPRLPTGDAELIELIATRVARDGL